MDQNAIDDLMGEFRPEYDSGKSSIFNHLVRNRLAVAQSYLDLRKPSEAEKQYELIKKYLSHLRLSQQLREKDFRRLETGEVSFTGTDEEYILSLDSLAR